MSVIAYISSIESNRNTIRNKLIELGLALPSDKLDKLAAAIENIVNNGAVNASVREGDTYTIPEGWHNGKGTVSGVSGGGNYTLQSKSVTPTKKSQNVTPDPGYYGLSSVGVGAIPEAYQDVSSVTAVAEDVLAGKIFVSSDGTITPGEMLNHGAVNETLNVTEISYTIPRGFHSGSGTVKIVLESKTVTPTKSPQEIVPGNGKLLSSVTVEPIPDKYVDTSDATAAPEHILNGETAYVGTEKVQGTMPVIGAAETTLDADNTSFVIPEGYHNGEGAVIIDVETQHAVPSKDQQEIQATPGKVISRIVVDPIPDNFQDISGVTATPGDVLDGTTFVDSSGVMREGTMVDRGALDLTIDGITTTSVIIPPGKHNGSGTVSLTRDIETALAAI